MNYSTAPVGWGIPPILLKMSINYKLLFMSIFFHEQLYRTNAVMVKFKNYPVTVCGAGALGANIAENLARSGFGKLIVIDRDRIEERNLSTGPYYRSDVGAFKAKILANNLYRAIGTKVDTKTLELTSANTTQLLHDSQLIVDVFDNSVARQVVKDYAEQLSIPCLISCTCMEKPLIPE
jgi:molybdopterin/thiamine biosynthesis adenylyltransferase